MKRIYRNLKFGIKNFIAYRKIIWNDRSWDHSYFLELMKFKIELMSKQFSKVKFYEGYEKDVESMNSAISILSRLIAEDYECQEQKEDYHKYFPKDSIFNDENVTEEERKIRYDKLVEWGEYAEQQKQNDYTELFRILKEELDKWWW